MKIQLNGQPKELESEKTVADLLQTLQLSVGGIAVALNMKCVPRSQHETTPLQEGDAVEILSAQVGG